MNQPSDNAGKEQRLLQNARREGLVVMAVWAAGLIWSTLVSYFFGYDRFGGTDRPAEEIGLVLGMPDWVFWAIVAPWALCFLFSIWFCFVFMADDDLGTDRDEGPGHA